MYNFNKHLRGTIFLIGVILMMISGCQRFNLLGSKPEAPSIKSISVSPLTLSSKGGSITINWNAVNAVKYTVNSTPVINGLPREFDVQSKIQSLNISIPSNATNNDKTYNVTFTAIGEPGTKNAEKTISVKVLALSSPVINLFSVNPTAMSSVGGNATLSWSASNVTSYTVSSSPSLSGLPSSISDTTITGKTLTIPANTGSSTITYTFTLTANGASGTTAMTKTVSIAESAPGQAISPSIASLSASPGSMSSGGGTETLNWSASNATGYKLSSSPAISGLPSTISDPSITSKTLTIPANTGSNTVTYTFTLTANGASGTTAATKTVSVPVSAPGQPTSPSIASFTASSSTLSSSGGTETLNWSASHVTGYKLSSSPALSGLPSSISDTTITNKTLTIPANTGSSTVTYTFTLTAYGASGTTVATKQVSITESAPGQSVSGQSTQPTISTFTASPGSFSSGGGSETLSWSASNVTGYKLSSSPALSGLPTSISDTTITSKTLTIPANTGSSTITYTFTLTANGTSGTTAATKTVSVSVSAPGTPTAPSITSFTAGTGSFSSSGGSETLSWSASHVTGYKLSSSPALSGLPSTISDTSVTSKTLTIPANTGSSTVTYTFTLTANGASGTTAATKTVSVPVSAPGQPTAPSISSFTAGTGSFSSTGGSETLSWSASHVTGYKLSSSPVISGLPATISDTTVTSQTLTIPANTGTSTTTYTFTLTANGASGTTAATKTVSVTVSAPGAPSISSFTAGTGSFSSSGGSETLSWSASNETGYTLSSSPSISGLPITISSTSVTSQTVTIPANTGSSTTTYTFTLTANGTSGTTAATKTVSVTVSAPTAPSISSFTAGTSSFSSSGGSETLSWSASNETGYTLSCSPTISGLPITISSTSVTSQTVTIPANTGSSTTTYTFTLTANGTSGTTAATKTVSVTVSAPVAPTISSFSAGTSSFSSSGGSETLSWSASNETGYKISVSPSISGLPITISNTSVTSQTVTMPANATGSTKTYTFTLTATGATGTTDATSTASVTVSGIAKSFSGTSYSFSKPTGIAVDAVGNIWVTNRSGNSVTEIPGGSSSTTPVVVNSSSSPSYSFSAPRGIYVDGSNNIFVANYASGSGTGTVTEIPNGDPSNSPTTFAQATYDLSGPIGIVEDSKNNLYVTNYSSTSGDSVTTIQKATTGGSGNLPAGWPVTVGKGPSGIAMDASGNMWIANSRGNSVSQLQQNKTVTTLSASSYKFNQPTGVAIDGSGNVWVTNVNGNSVTEIPVASTSTTPVVFNSSSYSFDQPTGIAVDNSGNIWITNYNGNSVTEIPNGSSSATPVIYSSSNSFTFNGPTGIAIDNSGNVWVTNASGNSVTELVGVAK